MHTLLIVIPAVFAVSCYAVPGPRVKLALLETGAVAHFATVVCSWAPWFSHAPVMFLELDPLAHLFVSLTSLLFLSTSVYFLGYHRKTLVSERVFLACMFALLASLCAVCMSRHLGVLWVSMEAASLAATPLIYFRLSARSLEATWKFLLMNSVGIALALLGVFCIAISTMRATPDVSLALRDLTSRAHELDVAWLRSGFLLMLVGFGTKLGLAPLHGWKPDAYGEAPPPIAALLSGGVTLGAFIGIVRVFEICVAAGLAEFAGHWLVVFGLVSIGTAAVFVIGATDYRRILAYTSVEHVGVMVIGVGLGAGGSYASVLHAMHNTLNKGVLFMAAGYFWRLFESNRVSDVRGALRHSPLAGILFLGGLCATCGLPPFGMFFSELGVVFAAVGGGHWWVAAAFVITLCVVFIAVMTSLGPVVFGLPQNGSASAPSPQRGWRASAMLIPAAILLATALGLGAYQPAPVRNALEQAAQCLRPSGDAARPAIARAVEEGRP